MAAQFKSNVRLREEKGFGSISMKRLIFSGTGAVFLFMGSRMTPFSSLSLPILLISFVALLMLSGSRGGLPLWQRLMLGWRARLMLAAAEHPTGAASQIVLALNLDAAETHLKSTDIFRSRRGFTQRTEGQWAIYNNVREATQDGTRLLVVDDFGISAHEMSVEEA
ncbi:MAG: hypothetical protein H6670_11080 [Anaerolineaceae bacterium]|nr:hypothetical protein [Anaerolineaceae bacterium]